jgi:hypothetical protein
VSPALSTSPTHKSLAQPFTTFLPSPTMLTAAKYLKSTPSFVSGSLKANGSVARASFVKTRYYATFPEESRLLDRYKYVKDPKTIAVCLRFSTPFVELTCRPLIDCRLSLQVSYWLIYANGSNVYLVAVRHVFVLSFVTFSEAVLATSWC